jgi:hypothetical protein
MSYDATAWIPLFPEEEIPFILAAVLRSGERLKKLSDNELENHLNDRLRDIIVCYPDFRKRPVEIQRETPLYDPARKRGRPLGRPDLQFIYSTGYNKPWPYFAIEAKRLHVTFASGWQSLVSEYVTGHQGMMCFIEERYAKNLSSGGMLGYVFDGETDKARASIAACIENNYQKLHCCKTNSFKSSDVQIPNQTINESVHQRSNGALILYHLLVPV